MLLKRYRIGRNNGRLVSVSPFNGNAQEGGTQCQILLSKYGRVGLLPFGLPYFFQLFIWEDIAIYEGCEVKEKIRGV